MADLQNMTSGKPGKLIFSFALPLMIGNLFQQLYTVADAMIVGQLLGVDAIAAVGASEWMVWLMMGTIQGLTQGFSIWMAQKFGARHFSELRNILVNSVFLAAISTAVLLIGGQLSVTPVLRLLKTPSDVFSDAAAYMRVIFWGIPITMGYNLLAAALRSLGDGKTPLAAMVLAAVINIGLDLLFVASFRMGVAGAAAATVIAQLCAGIFCLLRVTKVEILKLSKKDLPLGAKLCGHLLLLGFPLAFQNIVISVGGMTIQFVINGIGVLYMAGFTAANKLYGLLEAAATSYGYAMTTYTGQNLGAGQIQRIRQGYRQAMVIALVTSLGIMAVMVAGGRWILSWFITGKPEIVTQTLDIAYRYLFTMSLCLPVLYYLHVTRSCIQGLGNTVLPMVSGISEFVMRTGTALLLPLVMGRSGIFYAEVSAWWGADVVLFFGYLYCLRRLNQGKYT